jgi:hypothetical protein
MVLLYVGLVQASKGWTQADIDALTMDDFWEWVDGFSRMTELRDAEMKRAMARDRRN